VTLRRASVFLIGIVVLLSACTSNDSETSAPVQIGAVVPTRVTPTPTETPTPTVTSTPTSTFTPTVTHTPSNTPTETPLPTETQTPTVTPTETPLPTETPTETPLPTETATATPEPTETPSPEPTADLGLGGALEYGQAVFGRIDGDVYELVYTFDAQAGDLVTVAMNRVNEDETLDPLLILRNANGATLITNDDVTPGFSRDAGIIEFAIPETGSYTIVATRFGGQFGSSVGDFELSFTANGIVIIGGGRPVAQGTSQPQLDNEIVYGQRVTGTINNDRPEIRFNFRAQAGDVIGIRQNGGQGNLDSFLVLLSPEGTELITNDDDPAGAGFDSYIDGFVIPEDGVYTIIATRYNRALGTSSGTFELLLEREGESGATTTTTSLGISSLSYGDSTTGTISHSAPYSRYEFTGNAGDRVQIKHEAISGNLDPYLILVDPEGRPLVRNDDVNNTSLNAMIDIVLPEDGVYMVVTSRYMRLFGDSTGTYSLSLSLLEQGVASITVSTGAIVQDIQSGSPIAGALIENYEEVYTFFANAGDVINAQLLGASDTIDPVLVLEDAYGIEITRNDDNLMDAASVRNSELAAITIPQTGYYVFVVRSFSELGNFTIQFTLTESTSTGTPFIYLPHNPLLSGTIIEGQQNFSPLFGVGEWLLGEQFLPSVTILSTRLMPLPEGAIIERVTLDLTNCLYSFEDSLFLLGGVRVMENSVTGELPQISNLVVNRDRPAFAQSNNCSQIDITSLIQAAYARGAEYVQLQLDTPNRLVDNQRQDVIVFSNPIIRVEYRLP
jgi:hypothetical protein